MSWSAVFVVFFVSHQVGDYLLQTDWQARHKRGGLGRDPLARRALLAHTLTYSFAYVPVLIWVSSRLGWTTVAIAAAVALPHMIQDDGRLVTAYIRRVKRLDPTADQGVAALVDQAFHIVALLGAALLTRALA